MKICKFCGAQVEDESRFCSEQAGVNDAVSAVNQEKRQFNRAINELKSRTLQQVEMVY